MARLPAVLVPGGIPATPRPDAARCTRAVSSATRFAHAFALVRQRTRRACAIGDGGGNRSARGEPALRQVLDPRRRRRLADLHLNGWKIAELSVLARIPHLEFRAAHARLRLAPTLREATIRSGAPAAGGGARSRARCDRRDPRGALRHAARAARRLMCCARRRAGPPAVTAPVRNVSQPQVPLADAATNRHVTRKHAATGGRLR